VKTGENFVKTSITQWLLNLSEE